MSTYEQKKQRVLQLFNVTIAIAQQSKQNEYIKLLQDTAKHLDEGRFMVVVCGEFKSGKSSLLNALLNEVQDLFPVDIAITTNLVSTIAYSPTEKITAYVGPPDSDQIKELSIKRNEIRQYVTEKDNPQNVREAHLMEILTPNPLLKQGLVLVDTPGVGGLYARHTDITYDFIPNADAILYVSDALHPLSEEDLKFIKDRIAKHTEHILFVLTKSDRVKNYADIVRTNREKIATTLGRPTNSITIVPVSSYAKRNYLKTQDAEDLEDSNFPELERELWQFVGSRRGRVLLAKALTVLAQVVGDLRRPLQVEYDTCQTEDKQKLEAIESSLQETRSYLQGLQDNSAQWHTQLSMGLEDIRMDTQYRFDKGFANIRRNVDGYLSDDRMVETPELILKPLQHDINDLLYAMDRIINESANDLQSRIEFATGLALNPFEPDSLHQQSTTLTLQGLPPTPKKNNNAWDNMITVGQRGNTSGGFVSKILGFIGGVIGVFFGHPLLGYTVGEGAGYLLGAKSGAKQAMRQMHEQDRQHIYRYLMNMLADSQKDYNYSIVKAIKKIGDTMRADLLDKIKREKNSRERALKSFQETRNLTSYQANARIATLRGPLQQFDQLQQHIQTLIQDTMNSQDDQQTASFQIQYSGGSAKISSSSTNGNVDKGDWADA